MKTARQRPGPNAGRNRARFSANERPSHGGRASEGRVAIYGLHAVEAALLNPARNVLGLWATANALHRLAEPIARRGVTPISVTPKDLDQRLGADTVHQGALIEAEPLSGLAVEDLAEARLVLALDQITDPHNVGAILRSAAAFGVGGLVMTGRHSPPLSGALAKAASGALEYVPVVIAGNLAQALTGLGELGFWRIGLDSEAEGAFEDAPALGDKLALVLGAEDVGLRRLTRERCDTVLALTAASGAPIKSLNVSNAAAIALHHVAFRVRQASCGA